MAIVAVVAPIMWPKMQKAISYPIATIGFLVLGYSCILLWEEKSGMKVDVGPMAAIMIGVLLITGGVLWQTSLRNSAKPDALAAPTAAAPMTPAAPSPAPLNIIGNEGIITKDQQGENAIIKK